MVGRRVSSQNVRDGLRIPKDKYLGPKAGRDHIRGSIYFLPVAVQCTEVMRVEKILADSENEAFARWAPELGCARAAMGSISVELDSDEQGNAARYCDFRNWVCNNDSKGIMYGCEVKH